MKYVLRLQYILLFVLGLALSPNQLQAQQSKDNALERAVANAHLQKAYSSIATVNRGDISPDEIYQWFRRRGILSRYYPELELTYKNHIWKWGAFRPTFIQIEFLHKKDEMDFLMYCQQIQEEKARKAETEFYAGVTVAGITWGGITKFLTSDRGKQMLLSLGDAAFGGGGANTYYSASSRYTEDEIPSPPPTSSQPSRNVPNYKIVEDWKKETSVLDAPKYICIVKFDDGKILTITRRTDVSYYQYGYDTGILGYEGKDYDTFHNAAQAAWIYSKYNEYSPVGLKSSQKNRPESISEEENIPDYKVIKTWIDGKTGFTEIEFYGSSVVCRITCDLEGEKNTYRYGFKFNALSEGYGYDTFHHAAQAAWVYKKFNKVRTVGKR